MIVDKFGASQMSRYELQGFFYEYSLQDLDDNRAGFMSIGQKKFVSRYFKKILLTTPLMLLILSFPTALGILYWYSAVATQKLPSYIAALLWIAFFGLIEVAFIITTIRQVIELQQDLKEGRVARLEGMEEYRKFRHARKGIYIDENQNWLLQPKSNSNAIIYAMPKLKLILSWEYPDSPITTNWLHEIEEAASHEIKEKL
jgi:hypothetical protein